MTTQTILEMDDEFGKSGHNPQNNKIIRDMHRELLKDLPYSLHMIRSSVALAKDVFKLLGVTESTLAHIRDRVDDFHIELEESIAKGEKKRAASIAEGLKELLSLAEYAASLTQQGVSNVNFPAS